MIEVDYLRGLVGQRPTAAAEEVFGFFLDSEYSGFRLETGNQITPDR